MIAILDARYIGRFGAPLTRLGYTVLPTVRHPALTEAVAYHADMSLFPVDAHTVIAAPEVWRAYAARLAPYGIKVVQGETVLTSNYPSCIAYNVAKVGKTAFHLAGQTDPAVHTCLMEQGVAMAAVRQGFSGCSVCAVGNNAIITADVSIQRAAEQAGIETLLIRAGHIELPGYDYGFIGGASGRCGKRILFAGSLCRHPDGADIRAFCARHAAEPVSLDDGPLVDVGTIFCFSADCKYQ